MNFSNIKNQIIDSYDTVLKFMDLLKTSKNIEMKPKHMDQVHV